MARVDYTTDSETDSRLNPAEQAKFDQISAGYDSGSELSDREKDAINDLESQFDNKDSDLNPNQNDSASAAVNDQESSAPGNSFYQPSAGKKKSPVTFKSLLKKRGPIAAIAGILGLGGGILGIFLSPATMLQNIMENFTWKNDSATPSKISRIKQVMNGFLDSKDGPGICANSSKKIRCRTGKLSYKALTKFNKSGIIPVDVDGNEMKLKKTGYPEKNPTHWKVEGLNDGKPIESSKLKDELLKKENRKIASKVYGRTGLFKMRFRAWTGKHISKLYKKFGLKRNSAISKIDKKLGVKEKANKLKEKLPGFNDDKAIGGINERVTKSTEKLKKGGLVYVAAAGICLALKLPNIIASGVAAIQLVPLLGLVMDVILSPGSQAKASGLDSSGSGFSQETMETIGTMLTERGKMKGSDNAEGSALDSPYLLAAMGVNNDKPGIAKNYIPGYSVATNPIVRTLNSAEEVSEPVCNYILSPVAMYSSQAVDLAIDATGAATFGLTSLAKWIAKKTLATVTTELLKYAVGDTVKRVLKELAVSMLTSNNAQYKDLGDALGVGAAAFFASGSMGQMLPGLKMSQLAEFNGIQIANEEFQKEMDIASLSPFDTSSRYTFLGSIFHNMGNMMMANGTYSKTPVAMLSNILRLPSMALSYSSTAKAASGMYSDKYCGYAKDFSMGSGSSEDPAVNMAGLPCTGITNSQANMSVEEAIQIAEDEGWIQKDMDIPDGADISDLMNNGYIVKDTPLHDFVEDCGDASTGSYWFSNGGCTAPSDSTRVAKITEKTYKDEEGKDITNESFGTENSAKQYDDRKLSAMSVLLIDFQIAQSINGEDDEEDAPSTTAKAPDNGEAVGEPQLEEAQAKWGSYENGKIPDSELQALSFSPGNKMNKKAAIAMEEMNKAYKADNGSDLIINDAYREYDRQVKLREQLGSTAGVPGTSNHGWGLAADIEVGAFGSSTYNWLKANAHKYGYVHPAWAEPGGSNPEQWHWEYARKV
ncbi:MULTISPECIES: M15 family metallopeptidase [unclassified Candidatus Nanosynbacter]|uniref:M15 family metallopeptidase n=1 Tax=unclassified Candidatus Nanosynbacter TaxID=2725944 RepID=UPI001FB82F1D|nr:MULTISPECIES: M15 family metallopeptidase [unclassified Candidatus Nanosynbacter]MCJ1963660.1 M15 family metallopeptidase [Candidatus Nanosynbacter sp. TM7-033]UOG68142.1 M15 family metallopeptidase [Candidatus Nanosynbacter sp. HMT-352]